MSVPCVSVRVIAVSPHGAPHLRFYVAEVRIAGVAFAAEPVTEEVTALEQALSVQGMLERLGIEFDPQAAP